MGPVCQPPRKKCEDTAKTAEFCAENKKEGMVSLRPFRGFVERSNIEGNRNSSEGNINGQEDPCVVRA